MISINVAAASSCKKSPVKRPNVILVMTDDQGYGDLRCLGNEMVRTPHLDRLYQQSVRLTNFHVSPTCSPSRASLLTGRYANATGVWHTIMGRSLLHPDEVTVADCFRAGGYKTGIFGKWHLGDNFPCRPQDNGFDEVLVHGGGGVGQTPDYFSNDYYDDVYLHNGSPARYRGYCTDVWFDNALEFMSDCRTAGQSFFCYIPTNAAHGPFWVEEEYAAPYRDDTRVPNAEFYGMIGNIDKNVGRLLQFMKEKKLDQETILIFMTDNGSTFGRREGRGFNADMRGRKGSEYEGGHRVPCFIYWPGGNLVGPGDIHTLTAHIDWLPTLIDLCALKKLNGPDWHGKSLKPLLTGDTGNWEDRILVVDSQRQENIVKWRKSSVMNQKWRLVNGKELYDIDDDPSQSRDVSALNGGVVEKLRAAYDRWWDLVSERENEYIQIVLGNEAENPSRLTCHDWHGPGANRVWHQSGVRRAQFANGFWAVEVDRTGSYRIELRRWPLELDRSITEGIPESKTTLGTAKQPLGKAIVVKRARLKIAGADVEKPVGEGDKGVSFTLNLKKGKTTLQTWFSDDLGNTLGAYYVYVTRI